MTCNEKERGDTDAKSITLTDVFVLKKGNYTDLFFLVQEESSNNRIDKLVNTFTASNAGQTLRTCHLVKLL
jgi:hypothetical protein